MSQDVNTFILAASSRRTLLRGHAQRKPRTIRMLRDVFFHPSPLLLAVECLLADLTCEWGGRMPEHWIIRASRPVFNEFFHLKIQFLLSLVRSLILEISTETLEKPRRRSLQLLLACAVYPCTLAPYLQYTNNAPVLSVQVSPKIQHGRQGWWNKC